MKKHILYIATIIAGTFIATPVFATTMGTNVNIRPSMTLSVSSNDINLNLNPATEPFDTKDLTVTIGTNNPTGYKLYLTSDSTNLINTEDSSKTIETLPSSTPATGYDQASFPANYWGYRKSNGSSSSGNYLPFSSDLLVSSATGPSNEITTSIGLASKIDYLKESGTYTLDFKLNAVPTITQYYMQDLSDPTLASSVCVAEHPTIVFDSRDEQAYMIQRLPDNRCWMLDNLKLGRDIHNPDTTTFNLTSNNTDIDANISFTAYDLLTYGSNDKQCFGSTTSDISGYTTPCIHSSSNNDYGVWYNFAAATANTINTKNTDVESTQSICPKGWGLPSGTESTDLITTLGSNTNAFNPVLGGIYYDGTYSDKDTRSTWWSSTASSNIHRQAIYWQVPSPGLYMNASYRRTGVYVRCILK